MKVKEMIEKLSTYNPNAEFGVTVNGYQEDFEVLFGTSEGCTKENCDCVDLSVNTPTESI